MVNLHVRLRVLISAPDPRFSVRQRASSTTYSGLRTAFSCISMGLHAQDADPGVTHHDLLMPFSPLHPSFHPSPSRRAFAWPSISFTPCIH